ncbi:helix-turn-helix transcriptional regulator [Acaryochloris sp. 'Moss Beach']|uniref:helix-turn-helix domain-containing protein n=1 Tax=Acaryochloris sp. 'Moss Beach' TaxID=2740837 RepID=UPI001F3B48BA|nr:helix-turn-helix domain-containing protein [Acaryochloris sp. 'Moss Beach']
MTTDTMTIKWRLASVMADREIKYKELADKLGMHPVTVNKMKNTFVLNFRLTPETLNKLCLVLNCQPGDLLKHEEDSADITS